MAGCRRACSSRLRSAVSMRSTSGTRSCRPSARVITSVASCCGLICGASSTSNSSSPRMPSDCHESSLPLNCSGNTPMPTRLLRWMRSKLRAITALTPSSSVPLAAQSRLEPVPYSSPPKTTGRRAFGHVLHRRVVDEHLLAARLEQRDAAFLARAVGPGIIRFLMRTLAKVPRIITSWLPRRAP